MKNKLLITITLFAVLTTFSCKKDDAISVPASVSASSSDDMYTETLPTVQTPITRTINANIGGYLEALPSQYASHPKKKYPVIFFLHGLGELGTGSAADLNKITDNAIPNLIANKKFPSNFIVDDFSYQFIVISPQFKAWPQPADIDAMIQYAVKNYNIDTRRMYVCGLSMGGGGTWDYAWNYPSQVAGIVPICGASWPTVEKALPMAQNNLAVWAFHNNGDPTVPLWYSQDYVQYINDDNPATKAKLTVFDAKGHNAWTTATDPNYRENGQNIYEWMLSFKKNK